MEIPELTDLISLNDTQTTTQGTLIDLEESVAGSVIPDYVNSLNNNSEPLIDRSPTGN